MGYKLTKPYTQEQRNDFLSKYHRQMKLRTQETSKYLFALEADEMIVNDEIVINPEYEQQKEQEKRQEIAMLSLTGADVERGIYQAKGMDFDDIVNFIANNPPMDLDIKALKIELKANHFYRANPYVSSVGTLLGFSESQLDNFFKTGDWHELVTEEA